MSEFTCHLCKEEHFEEDEVEIGKCGHIYCLLCLSAYLKSDEDLSQKCPIENCKTILLDKCLEAILDDYYLQLYKKKTIDDFLGVKKCLLTECDEVIILNDQKTIYECQKCSVFICVICNAAHRNMDCEVYQSFSNPDLHGNIIDDKCLTEISRAQAVLNEKRKLELSISLKDVECLSIITNDEPFQCIFCFKLIRKEVGMRLRNCFHYCCRDCFKNFINNASSYPIKCLNESCSSYIDDRDIRALLTPEECDDYDRRQVKVAINKADDCRNANCKYIIIIDNLNVTEWTCKLCNELNCLKCQIIHTGRTCKEFQAENPKIFEKLAQNKDIMNCLTCHRSLSKAKGCDYIKCPFCGADLCWATRKYRYGLNGCGCSTFKRCSPECNGCNPHRCLIM